MRFYRALLHLYPTSYRVEYGDELRRVFAERTRSLTGPGAIVAAIGDVVPNALAVHWDLLRQDLRGTFRALRRTPGFATAAVLVVALGVGANTAAFSVANFVLVQPLPFKDPERLVRLWQSSDGYRNEVSPAIYRDWKSMSRSFSEMGAFTNADVNFVSTGEPRRLSVALQTPEIFPLLGVAPLIGRVFVAGDEALGRTVVLSYGLWATHFASDSAVLGTRVNLDGDPYTVIGVMPPTFHFPARSTDLWAPLQFREDAYQERSNTYLYLLARLRAGTTLDEAKADMAVITTRLAKQYPESEERTSALINGLRGELGSRARLLLYALAGAALCILLLACANLANLLLARATSRGREIAVRSALGAGRERLIRQMATESIVLGVAGGLAGVFVAIGTMPVLARLVPNTLPIAERATLDVRVLIFAVALISFTGLAFGILPVLSAGGIKAFDALREGARAGGGNKQRVRAALVMFQVMASVVLLISSGLLVRAIWRLQSIDTGFQPDGVVTLSTGLAFPKYATVAERARFYNHVLEGVRRLPGVTNAAYVTGLPMARKGGIWGVTIKGRPKARDGSDAVSMRYITSQYFAAMSIPLKQGRDVEETDINGRAFAAVVSESFVKQHFPGEDPIGKQFDVTNAERTIVGVVGDVRVRGLEQESEPQVYLPYQQVPDSAIIGYIPRELVIRTTASIAALLPEIRRIVREADVEQPISNVQPLSAIVAGETASRLAQLRVLAILAAVALLLAGVGIHGLLSYGVTTRAQEIGVRMALGAENPAIVGMIVREGFLLALGGAIPGIAVGYAAARGMQALLAGVQPGDPLTIGVAVGLCCLAAFIGCLAPGLRAVRIDPISALRAE